MESIRLVYERFKIQMKTFRFFFSLSPEKMTIKNNMRHCRMGRRKPHKLNERQLIFDVGKKIVRMIATNSC